MKTVHIAVMLGLCVLVSVAGELKVLFKISCLLMCTLIIGKLNPIPHAVISVAHLGYQILSQNLNLPITQSLKRFLSRILA